MKHVILYFLLMGNCSYSQNIDSTFYLNYNSLDSTYEINSNLDGTKYRINNITLMMEGAPRTWDSKTNQISYEQNDILKRYPKTKGTILVEYIGLKDGRIIKFLISIN